ncbi:immunity 22 family protein [Blastopirellula retiformator]|uniref:Immunity protein 22 n=1 Tax=Blastopirellula retiformator TaxID=2527970 RepID=A0A5C5VJN8_9BACT|nr:immunity 22 family protein [Blastopirellula retiformator]TWT38818.1 hypothetical protein Enr8_05120 [Blastopirellula retiformator]
MREDGFVSLWLGVAPDADALSDYVALTYDEDGEVIPSLFMREFDLPYWDEDFREADTIDGPSDSVAEVLSGFSYNSQLIEQFQRMLGESLTFPVNAAVLLYNFNHQSPTVTQSDGAIQLRFVGVAKYSA